MTPDVESWLGSRMKDVPRKFRFRLRIRRSGSPPEDEAGPDPGPLSIGVSDVPDGLARRGLDALTEAADRPGRDRESAFRLLAADAYLTYACEAILDEPEPGPRLRELIRRIGAEAG